MLADFAPPTTSDIGIFIGCVAAFIVTAHYAVSLAKMLRSDKKPASLEDVQTIKSDIEKRATKEDVNNVENRVTVLDTYTHESVHRLGDALQSIVTKQAVMDQIIKDQMIPMLGKLMDKFERQSAQLAIIIARESKLNDCPLLHKQNNKGEELS